MGHMPHSTVLRATIRSNNNRHLLFEQPSSRHSHATSCASLTLASSFHYLHTITKSLHSEHFYAINQLLARIALASTSAPHQMVPAPHPGCPSSPATLKMITQHLVLLISDGSPLLTTFAGTTRWENIVSTIMTYSHLPSHRVPAAFT